MRCLSTSVLELFPGSFYNVIASFDLNDMSPIYMDRNIKVRALLWKEIALKGRTTAIAFVIASVFLYFYHFNIQDYQFMIESAAILSVFANVIRFWSADQILKSPELCPRQKNIMRACILINVLLWSLIYSLGALELHSTTYDYAVLICMFAGTVAGSIVTLGYDKITFLIVQFIFFIPMMVISLYQHSTGQNPLGHYLCFIFAIFIIYQFKQFSDYRKHLLEKYNAQLDLEASFIELERSKTLLVEQTAKIIHSSKLKALSEMAGGLAHEVNNSLMVIIGNTQQVQRELKKQDVLSESLNTRIKHSTEAILKIKNVIEGLKYFSLEMDEHPKEVTDLKDIVGRTLSYTHELIKTRNISLEINDIPEISVYCHSFQITQILFNLTMNAVDSFRDMESERLLRYGFKTQNGFLLVEVSNNGKPIEREHIQKLFQPFFSTKDVNEGSGLSLSISKGIALDHKGDLFFEDRGITTFVLKLPIHA